MGTSSSKPSDSKKVKDAKSQATTKGHVSKDTKSQALDVARRLANRGVSLSAVLMSYEIATKTGTLREDCTTAELANEMVIPLTKDRRTSFAEYLRDTKGWPLKAAEIHVVHSWQMRAVDTLLAVAQTANAGGPTPQNRADLLSIEWHKKNRPENLERCFFLCLFGVNQHSIVSHPPGDPDCEIDKFHLIAQHVYAAHGKPILVILDEEYTPLKRTCCLEEIYAAITASPSMRIDYVLPSLKYDGNIDAASSVAHNLRHKDNILRKIQAMPGGIQNFNQVVVDHVSRAACENLQNIRETSNHELPDPPIDSAGMLAQTLNVILSLNLRSLGISPGTATLASQICSAISHILADVAETDPSKVRTHIQSGVSILAKSYVQADLSSMASVWFRLCLAEFTGHIQHKIKMSLQDVPNIFDHCENDRIDVKIISISGNDRDDASGSKSGGSSVGVQRLDGSRIGRQSVSSAGSVRRGVSTSLDETPRASLSVRELLPVRTDAKLIERFDVDEIEFAAGGHGKVFKAKDKHFPDLTVVIKKILCNNEEKRALFRKEVNIMKELDHPNICKVLETYEEGRFFHIVMENCEGGELFDRIQDGEHGGMAEINAAEIIHQVCSALMFAHNRKIAHRDLKPENIVFCSRDPTNHQVKVIDWGLGFHFELARMKSAVGSLAYAAPEVLEADADEGRDYTSQCDLWSLGALTYVILCGKPPFWGSLRQQLIKMKKEDFPMSKAPWPQISDNAKDFITDLLRYDPNSRLTVDQAVCHPWFDQNLTAANLGTQSTAHLMTNLHSFSNNSKFFAICVASAARQLDHNNLQHIYKVFQKMDANHDGTIDINEIKSGFQEVYGQNSEEVKRVMQTFKDLDLDGSGVIDYTEFCAAALGEKMLEQENVLWSAFKAFDVHCDDGKITKEEIVQVLQNADVQQAWSAEVCKQVAQDIVDRFDKDGVGYLTFEAWLSMMKAAAWDEGTGTPTELLPGSGVDAGEEWVAWLSLDPRTSFASIYPGEIAKLLEDGLQRGEKFVHLGAKFHGSRVYFQGRNSKPFQRTLNGLRDVRRIELAGRGTEAEEVVLRITGTSGQYGILDEDVSDAEERRVIVHPENAVNSALIAAEIKGSKLRSQERGADNLGSFRNWWWISSLGVVCSSSPRTDSETCFTSV